MKKASEDLKHEHEVVTIALNVLEKMASNIQKHENADANDLKGMVDFLILFADKCHHGKEEIYYFPALENAGITRSGGPIGAMLQEHEKGRLNIRQMGLYTDLKAFAAAASSYVTLMRNHIEKENNILFMMGDQRLSEKTQTELLENFEEHENKVVGEGKHELLHALLEKLVKKYLD